MKRFPLGWTTCAFLTCVAACSGSDGDTTAAAPSNASTTTTTTTVTAPTTAATTSPTGAASAEKLGPDSATALSRIAPTGPPTPLPATTARDPGPRSGRADSGNALTLLSSMQRKAFEAGRDDFLEVEDVAAGLGPTMNLDSCGGCHAQPAFGGTSPALNPQVAFATTMGARNVLPPFITAAGPVREARFVRSADGSRDGGVHALFTIRGRSDTPAGCAPRQPDFATEWSRGNVALRIPTPVFGAGLIESIADREILRSAAATAEARRAQGIAGRPNVLLAAGAVSGQPNRSGNDGTLGRFGWKAQNKSLLIFSGEAYNVEMGITNGAFPNERDETEGCGDPVTPNDDATLDAASPMEALSSIDRFTLFMRFLAPPARSLTSPGGADSIERGRQLFTTVGCALCHTPALRTGNASVVALRNQTAELYSDLLLHDMGHGLADGVRQGQAGDREFRTAPLWGLGQRLFFLHDGRTNDLRAAITWHRSDGSEANGVISRYGALPDAQQQDMLNFLRSL